MRVLLYRRPLPSTDILSLVDVVKRSDESCGRRTFEKNIEYSEFRVIFVHL